MGTTSLYATHLMGGEIELICVNSGTNPPTYRIRVRIYRDCEGISQPSTITVRYQSSSCNVNQTITLNRVSITDFTPLCPGQQSVCQNSNSPNIGWEEHVYESNPIQLQACTDWVISTTDCCRNSSITTGSQMKIFTSTSRSIRKPPPVITPRDIVTAPLRSYVITSPSASIPAFQTQMETASCLASHTAAPQASILPLPTTTLVTAPVAA
jgi:hypothetical protein